jgi:predicted nucleotidyltransferase
VNKPVRSITLMDSQNPDGDDQIVDLLALGGSRSFGLNTENSDYDYVSLVMPSVSNLVSLHPFEYFVHDFQPPYTEYRAVKSGNSRFSTICVYFNTESSKEVDLKVYSFRKFFGMLMNKDVQSFEILFSREFDILSPKGKRLVNSRHLFLSRTSLFDRFRGYAEHERRVALGITTGTLGEDRKLDLSKYGYSAKNAAHCIRLLHEGAVLLRGCALELPFEGDLLENLRRFRSGQASRSDFENEVAFRLENLEKAYSESPLPADINIEDLDTLYRDLCLQT